MSYSALVKKLNRELSGIRAVVSLAENRGVDLRDNQVVWIRDRLTQALQTTEKIAGLHALDRALEPGEIPRR